MSANALVGGVNSPVRAWAAVGGMPVTVASAHGAYLTDAHGQRLVDLIGGYGPAILGHSHPSVVQAVQRAADHGLSVGATTAGEERLAHLIAHRYGPAERVRLVSTGTEAAMTALRIARAATGRTHIIKFAGCYHGHVDSLLVAAGSGSATLGEPDSAGVPDHVARDTIVVPYGDLEAVSAALDQYPVAAIITEATPANMGVVRAPDGFNAALAEMARGAGALLILDEVLTGFRVGPAGWWGLERDWAEATGDDAWLPDLVLLGKVIGGGLPLAAVAGRASVMELLAPVGPVYQAGTLSGNPVAVAAGIATLEALTAEAYAQVDRIAQMLHEAVRDVLEAAGVTHAWGKAGSLMSLFLGLSAPPRTFTEARAADASGFAGLFHALYAGGVAVAPSTFEAWFVSAAHTEVEVEMVADAVATWVRS